MWEECAVAANELLSCEDIKNRIYTIRGVQVMLDSDLVSGGRVSYSSCDFRSDSRIEKCPNSASYQMWDFHMCYNCDKRTVADITPKT